jgi:hypothetical protein
LIAASIYPFFAWCERTWLCKEITVHESLFPALETIHLFGLVLLQGTVLILSLRLLGLLMPHLPVPELARALGRYTFLGLGIMLPSGVLMFVAPAVRCYGNTSFWVKMCFLATALVFHFTYFRQALRYSKASECSHVRAKVAAFGALVLWFGVEAAGRSIGFFG